MRSFRRQCVVLVLLFVLCWVAYPSSQERIIIDIDQVGGYRLPIALPELKGGKRQTRFWDSRSAP